MLFPLIQKKPPAEISSKLLLPAFQVKPRKQIFYFDQNRKKWNFGRVLNSMPKGEVAGLDGSS